MRLIARKPCSFGGKQYRIGEEIPEAAVLHPKQQERWGVLSMVENEKPADAPKAERKPLKAEKRAKRQEAGAV